MVELGEDSNRCETSWARLCWVCTCLRDLPAHLHDAVRNLVWRLRPSAKAEKAAAEKTIGGQSFLGLGMSQLGGLADLRWMNSMLGHSS